MRRWREQFVALLNGPEQEIKEPTLLEVEMFGELKNIKAPGEGNITA